MPRDLRLTSGEVLRLQCAILPNGGRMLSYTYVTDIVRHADELEILQFTLDTVQDGIILLDSSLNVGFINEAARHLFRMTDEEACVQQPFALLIGKARTTGMFGMPAAAIEAVIASCIARVRTGDAAPQDLLTRDGRHVQMQCTALPNGGRMLTYRDVTMTVRDAGQLAKTGTHA
jgi:PAS domain-containing protein